MDNKPDLNQPASPSPPQKSGPSVGGDYIHIGGDASVAVVGTGSQRAKYIAGRDMTVNGDQENEIEARFSELLTELKSLIAEAQSIGEIDEKLAKEALESLDAAADLAKEKSEPVKKKVLGKLQYVADVLEAATDVFQSNGPARLIIKALPIVTLLIKIVPRIF
jgi:hypothetical protein